MEREQTGTYNQKLVVIRKIWWLWVLVNSAKQTRLLVVCGWVSLLFCAVTWMTDKCNSYHRTAPISSLYPTFSVCQPNFDELLTVFQPWRISTKFYGINFPVHFACVLGTVTGIYFIFLRGIAISFGQVDYGVNILDIFLICAIGPKKRSNSYFRHGGMTIISKRFRGNVVGGRKNSWVNRNEKWISVDRCVQGRSFIAEKIDGPSDSTTANKIRLIQQVCSAAVWRVLGRIHE